MNVPLNQIITKNMKVCSCSQQTYVCTTRKAFACRVDRAVIRMKDSVFVWPSCNSRLIIPCRIIRTLLRGLNPASFPFFYCHGSTRRTVFSPPYTFVILCVGLLPDDVLSNISVPPWIFSFYFFFVLFSRTITACDDKATLIARVVVFMFVCIVHQLQFPNHLRNSTNKRGIHRLIVNFTS